MILEVLAMLWDALERAQELLAVISMACGLSITSLALAVREGWLSW